MTTQPQPQPTAEQYQNLVMRQQRTIEIMAQQNAQQAQAIAEQQALIEAMESALQSAAAAESETSTEAADSGE